MDDTHKSGTSDANTTRKRRSSILKSQRPPRTPFSDLEFNVATPTDTVKSRRVSFSRRTGVAEFVTNEATTTWKNFYEEHNKSLESSGNDSEVKMARQPIGHIGKRIFDQQFEEMEAVDFLRQMNNPSLNINSSINNINLTQQLASLESTDNIKLSAPQANFELSTFTDNHIKLFGDELTAPMIGEISERIDVNFSDIQAIDQGKDDLDEIQRDLARAQNNVLYSGPFADRQNMSEYIEIDLNTTHITMGNEQSDMSITDTIHSQVQDVSKSCSIDKKINQTKDWLNDKENIAINPYVTPSESVNFAINEEADKVLVFDGKRLTLQTEHDPKNYRKSLLPNRPTMETPQRKTIVLNVNDDLPNFIEDMHISKIDSFKGTLPNYIDEDLQHNKIDKHKNVTIIDQEKSVTDAIPSENMLEKYSNKSRTVVYENDTCNVSITQALPANIIQHESEKRQTHLYEVDGNMSVTQAVPSNVVFLKGSSSEKRKTILFEEDMANISMTQALPVNIIGGDIQKKGTKSLNEDDEISVTQENEKRNTIIFENTNANVSVTHAIHSNILDNALKCDKNRTVTFGNDTMNISLTQAVPNNIIFCEEASLQERIKTVLYDNDSDNISVTQAIPSNIILPENITQAQQRRTILYENDTGNISVTQAIPSKIILPEIETQKQKRRTILYENDTGNISTTQAIPSKIILPEIETQVQKRRTMLYENDTGNMSVTQAIPSNIILAENETQAQRRRTILYENDTGNISVTQAIPSNIILAENETQAQRRRTILYENDTGNISVTQAIPSNIILAENETQAQKRTTILYENNTGNDISVTQTIPSNIIYAENETQAQRRKTILYENHTGDISVTQAIPSKIILPESETQVQKRKTMLYDNDSGNISVTQGFPSNIILAENETQAQRRRTVLYETDTGNISVTLAIPSNIILAENETQAQKRRTILYENDAGNISVTQAVPSNIILPEIETQVSRKETILYDNDTGNTSGKQVLPNNIIISQKSNSGTNEINNGSMSSVRPLVPNSCLRNEDVPTAKNISVTSNNTILHEDQAPNEKRNNNQFENAIEHVITQSNNILSNQSIHEMSNCNRISSTGPLNVLLSSELDIKNDSDSNSAEMYIFEKDKKELLTCQEYKADVSITPAPLDNNTSRYCGKKGNIRDTAVFHDNCEVVMTNILPSDLKFNKSTVHDQVEKVEKLDNIVYNMDSHMSTKQKIKNTLTAVDNENHTILLGSENKQQLQIGQGTSSISADCMQSGTITKPIPTTLSSIQNEFMEKSIKECKTNRESSSNSGEVLLYQVLMKHSEVLESKTIDKNDELSTDEEMMNNSECALQEHKVQHTMDGQKIPNPKMILDDILDISNASIESGIDDKNVMTEIASKSLEDTKKEDNDNISAESMFYITNDSDDEDQSNKQINQNVPPSSPLHKKEENPTNVDNVQNKLVEVRSIIHDDDNSPTNNRHYEKIVCLGIENETEVQITSPSQIRQSIKDRKSYRTANDTDHLLQMLSDLTETKVSDILEDDEKPEAIVLKEHIALENKGEVVEKRRISFEPKQELKALNGENMLKNLTLTQAALQKSQLELDKSNNFEDTKKDQAVERDSPRKKYVRMSNEVVKTLQFEEDDTASDTSIQSDKISPLKKTAFGETSYMKECKSKVIPSYLKDVSDGLKALMHDLVKPTADTTPYEAISPEKNLKKNPSFCSTQVQANLITSSQIDLDTELYSNPTSTYDIKTQAAFANEVTTTDKISNSHALKSPILSLPKTESDKSSEYELTRDTDLNQFKTQKQSPKKQAVVGKVLVFDHENPLNNVFFAPTDCADVHRYNPVTLDATLCGSDQTRSAPILANDKDVEVERVAMQYSMDSRGLLPHVSQQSGEACSKNITFVQSIASTTSKPMSIDHSTDVRMVEVKDIEINTSITMKGNKELLEASSSLTLVDDALTQNVLDVDIDTNTTTSQNSFADNKPNSPVKIIYQIDECGVKSINIDSDGTSNDEQTLKVKEQKRNKRNYSSTKHKNYTPSDLDVTPKPTSKVQKLSTSPIKIIKTILDMHHASPEKSKVTKNKIESMRDEEMCSPDKADKKSPQRLKDKTGTKITVQRLITEYHIETTMDQNTLNKQIVEALMDQPGKAKTVNSDEADSINTTSSKNIKERDDYSTSTSSRPVSDSSGKNASCVNWRSDLANELGSKNMVSECESSANVVDQIDMLPFMGSPECEWEWSCGDTWSFRLLHARLRLTVRLAPRHDNDSTRPRTHVRADTPLIALNVEIARHEEKNPVGWNCVRFALETMRHVCGVEWRRAGEVPRLVRRCAGAARLAARWAKHMHHAQAHLAYHLTRTGHLTLKVANIPLRSVWEVQMRVEMSRGEGAQGVEGEGVPCPRACGVRVRCVLSDCTGAGAGAGAATVSDAQVHAALATVPRDWGHVPTTIWRIFKYLKNKSREHDLLAA